MKKIYFLLALGLLGAMLSAVPTWSQSKKQTLCPLETEHSISQKMKNRVGLPPSLTAKAAASEDWRALGMASFIDSFSFNGTYQVELQQYTPNPRWFRLVQPYTQAFYNEGWDVNGTPAEYLEFKLLKEGDSLFVYKDSVWVYEAITHDSLVWFRDCCTGYYGEFNNSTDTLTDNIYITHPGGWSRWGNQESILHNRVLSYQENGYPDVIQLAPYYWIPKLGGWNYTQEDSIVLIKFPVVKTEQEQSPESHNYTITVDTPGTFGNVLLTTVEQWSDVDELTVIGHLNEDDLKLLSRLEQMSKLDLSQTDITVMTGCSGLAELQEVLLPSTVIEIGIRAFFDCISLREISAPNATSIGSSAFEDCQSLTTVSLPAATSIGSSAFYYCKSLTTVSLPAATSIGSSAFRDCESLTTVSLPAATSIGSNAFYDCQNLTTVSLPAATSIGSWAFQDCRNLTTVSLPAATSIGSSAFQDCYSLTTVNLPACLQSLGDYVFSGCSNLQHVYCHVIVPLTTTAFYDVGSSATLHVPAFSVSSYRLHGSWYSFYKIVPLEGEINQLAINSSFTIADYTGLAEKIDLSIYSTAKDYNKCGHLTIAANSPMHIGRMYLESFNWTDNNFGYVRTYPYCNTLITQNEVSTDKVTIDIPVLFNQWNFHSFPFDVKVSDISVPQGTLWVVRQYSGADRAALTGNTWQNMTNDMILKAGEGYIFHCANEELEKQYAGAFFTIQAVDNENKNNLFTHSDVVKPLNTYPSERAHNSSWNLVGNPYPSYYNTSCIEHNGVITVWNGNGYSAYSLLDDDYQLRPNEAFFVQCPADATSMTFKAEGRTHEYRSNDAGDNYYTRARASESTASTSRAVYNFTLSNADFTDRARLVVNPEAKMDYEINCDASKFMSDNQAVPQLYVYDNGIRYAIDERPLGDGIIGLGARFGLTGEYTIQLKNVPTNGESILLTDHETGNRANLAEAAYTFTTQAGTYESRFTIQVGSGATGINEIANSESADGESLYDLQGRRTDKQQKGVYLVKQNGKSRKVLK